MKIREFKAGDRIDAISSAGEDMEVWEAHGISASVFKKNGEYCIPIIESRGHTGKLDAFLDELSSMMRYRVAKPVFINVINPKLAEYLARHKIESRDMNGVDSA